MEEIRRSWPSNSERLRLQNVVAERLAEVLELLAHESVAPKSRQAAMRASIQQFDFENPIDTASAADTVIDLLKGGMVHMMHPGYFGLFNPTVVFPAILADLITASLNPQLAVWSHAPVPVEMERRVIHELGAHFSPDFQSGHFTTGGAEANYEAVLLALTTANSRFSEDGTKAFENTPCLYVSTESHLAWYKIAHQSGIGRNAVRLVHTDGLGRLDSEHLRRLLEEGRSRNHQPVFIGATAGTTNAGMVDPLKECADIAREYGAWFHVDAAWGGAIRILPELSSTLDGIELADSITIDAHKWLSVPMGAGILLCKDNDLLGETFRVTASYMPEGLSSLDPYTHSIQWSRRFIGLKLFLALATVGWEGYRALLRRSLALAARLKILLEENSWSVVNDSPVGVLCFEDDNGSVDLKKVAMSVVDDGRTWLSSAKFEGRRVLRACVTSHQTQENNLTDLIDALEAARTEHRAEL